MKMSSGKMGVRFWEREIGIDNPDLEVTGKPVVHEAVRMNEVSLGKQDRQEEKKTKDKDP